MSLLEKYSDLPECIPIYKQCKESDCESCGELACPVNAGKVSYVAVEPLMRRFVKLKEETSITSYDITITHLVDFSYPLDDCYVEVYVGKLNKNVTVCGDENDLYWSELTHNFFDSSKYAGYGNIGHIMELIWLYKYKQLKLYPHVQIKI